MTTAEERPLSALVAQGWEIVGFASGRDPSFGTIAQHVLLRRQRNHKMLSIRPKSWGGGFVVKEVDL